MAYRARGLMLLLVLCLAALGLAGCGESVDSGQLDLCRRVLPALHPDGTQIRELRFAGAASSPRIRIDYAARAEGGETRTHFLICTFAGGRLDANRLELTGVRTDEGAWGEARMLYLKRFWFGAFAPGVAEALPQVMEVPSQLAYALQQLINAIALAAIYGLLATAYSLIYGLVGRINLAFGDWAVIGAYGAIGAVASFTAFHFESIAAGLAVALIVATALTALWSWYLGGQVIAPLHSRHRHGQPILVATAALAITIQEFLRLSQGVRDRWLPHFFSEPLSLVRAGRFVVTISPLQLYISACAFAAALGLLWVMARTRFGRQWRAFADDPVAAALFGISAERILSATFILAGLNAGLAGWIVAVYYGNVSFSMGTMLGLKALLAAIIGGIGRVEGALIGGILIGLIEAGWSAYFDIASRDIVVFSLLVVMFVLRPGGLLGFSGPTPREV